MCGGLRLLAGRTQAHYSPLVEPTLLEKAQGHVLGDTFSQTRPEYGLALYHKDPDLF